MSQRLLIRVPRDDYGPERRYACEVLLGQFLGLDYQLEPVERQGVSIRRVGDPEGEVVLADGLFQTPIGQWLTPAVLPSQPLARRTYRGSRLPVLAPSSDQALAIDGGKRCATIGWDLFGAAFFWLTRLEEAVCPERDAHGRFPAHRAIAVQEDFLSVPVVDQYTELLWEALSAVWPDLQRKPQRYQVFLSHDVDMPHACLGRRPASVWHACAGDLFKRRAPDLAWARMCSFWQGPRRHWANDPYDTFDFIMAMSEQRGLRSAFYFIAGHTAGERDGTYQLDHPWIQALLGRMRDRRHEIGLHPSYHTYRNAAQTRTEFTALREAARRAGIEQARWGGRQHYLRFEAPDTWQNWESAGLAYDSTLTFADRPGFRCGTCREFPVFNLRTRRQLSLIERPLIAMEVALTQVMQLRAERVVAELESLAATCRRLSGNFSLLWHNSSLATAAERRCYAAVLDRVAP